MDNYVGKKLDKTCPACKQGWLHQYPQDKPGTHRCGRCGELDTPKAAKPAVTVGKPTDADRERSSRPTNRKEG